MHDTGLIGGLGNHQPPLVRPTKYGIRVPPEEPPPASLYKMVHHRVQQLVEQVFYKHGHFCASYPQLMIAFVGVVVLVCSYPMFNLPLPGTAPIEYTTPLHHYQEPPRRPRTGPVEGENWEGGTGQPRWFSGPPVGYIQQFIINATVSPWQRGMVPEDAFRAPLHKALDIDKDIENFVATNGKGVRSFCLYVQMASEPKKREILPKHNCLVLSPANVWKRDKNVFQNDPKLVETIFRHTGQAMDTGPSTKDLLFGVPSKYTGIHRFYLRSRQRQIVYAVTMVLQSYNESFVHELRQFLKEKYDIDVSTSQHIKDNKQIVHIYYRERRNLLELSPLIFIYVLLLLYIYFSVKKIEMVKSKLGLAFAAVVMVMMSLSTSVGICMFFGLTPTLSGSEIFPYLVVIIGLENILVFTKSVVSTPVHLAVKSRIAQGLSKEGWSITKNLCTELLIVIFGFFTFVPAIQEFCLFALVGLLTDFFLQMVYFVSVLSIDIRRMELSDLHKNAIQEELQNENIAEQSQTYSAANIGNRIPRSKSAPRSLHHMALINNQIPSPDDPELEQGKMRAMPSVMTHRRTPRRLRIIYFWASTRMMQRLIMTATVLWILFTLMFMYKAGLVDHLRDNRTNHTLPLDVNDIQSLHRDPNPKLMPNSKLKIQPHVEGEKDSGKVGAEKDSGKVGVDKESGYSYQQGFAGLSFPRRMDKLLWRKLPEWHWQKLFGCYNISLKGRYISVLPPIDLSMVINPKDAISMRHQLESDKAVKWYQDVDYRLDILPQDPDMPADWMEKEGLIRTVPLYQASVWDYYVTMALGILSGASLVILIMLLFKCVALKRIRMARYKKGKHADIISKVRAAFEAVPWVLDGHTQEIECLFSEGSWVVSCCLGGEIRMWNPASGECMLTIDRPSYLKPRRSYKGSTSSVSGGGSVRKRHSSGPELAWAGGDGSQSDCSPGNRGTLFDQPNLAGAIKTDFCGHSSWDNTDISRTSSSPVYTESSPGTTKSSPDPISQGGYNFKSIVDSHTNHSEKDHESDSAYPSPPTSNRNSQNLSTIEEDEGAFRQRAWSANSMMSNRSSPHWAKFEIGYNSPKSPDLVMTPDSAFHNNYGRFSFDEDTLHRMGSEEDIHNRGMTGVHDGPLPPVWCLCCSDQLVVVGCRNGRIEIWDTNTGFLLGFYDDKNIGATEMCMIGNRVVIARLDGTIDFLDLVSHHSVHVSHARLSDFMTDHRGVTRSNSATEFLPMGGSIICSLFKSVLAHQQPINDMQVSRDHVITASQDHTLKVYRLEDALCLFTLRAHTGSVTSLYVDKATPYSIASGSTDGIVCLWNTLTGCCVHRLRGHISTVLSVTLSHDHVISVGMDNRLCVWKRRRGRLLHVIQMDPGCSSSVVTLSNRLMVTGGQGYVVVWDIVQGEPLRVIKLGGGDHSVRQIVAVENSSAIVCDYGNELRVVQLPTDYDDKTD
ncbi:sterol regulatory element-binding protein cleavage-activating protein-like [Amphiura filiformis]|uniref:sterol regulatory element-binding protein cleavage-activating protein-like n=1 Tax=Amphiura filiformis TaxID=82378 RepID=UPI003B21921B